jgi:hypothetical protein
VAELAWFELFSLKRSDAAGAVSGAKNVIYEHQRNARFFGFSMSM